MYCSRLHEYFINIIAVSSCYWTHQHALVSWIRKQTRITKKERDYLKNKLFSKVPIISGMCGEKDLIGKEKSLRKKKRVAVLKKKLLIPHVKVILILFLKNMSHLKLYILMLLLMMKYLPSIISQIVKQI